MNQRGWVWIDENQERSEEEVEKITPLLDSLAKEWSALHDQDENQQFIREADIEDGYDYEFENEADEYRYYQLEKLHSKQHTDRIASIEDALAEHGARMMRPYEHWNEDERYMQYMECDRFGDSCY